MSQDWLWWTASRLGNGIGTGEIDPVALAGTYLAAIEAHPLRDRIYARVTTDRALAEARAAAGRAAAGRRLGPLDGVPASWKDLFDTAGVATEAGSALLRGRVPDNDARVLANATAAGLVCLGKTHMSELAFSGLGYNPVTATPPARHDADAVPGGSSSGAAASLAFGLAPLAIGSDTGGSVRIPAVWNDLVGLKPSHGRLPTDGMVPLCARFDTVGPLCRSVADAALSLSALEGGKAADLAGAGLDGVRFMLLETIALDDLRPAPAAGFRSAAARLEAAGARIERREVPYVAEAQALAPTLFATEAYATWEHVIEAAPEKMYGQIRKRFRGGRDTTARDYIRSWQALDGFRSRWLADTAGFDAVILPTAPNLPPKLDRLIDEEEYYVTENLLTLRNTRIGHLMGLAALTLPTGVPATGITLMTPPGSEERLLRLGAAAEEALS